MTAEKTPETEAPIRNDLKRPDGVRLAVEVWGPEWAPPVLLAHGFGQTRHAWGASALRIAAAGFCAISADGRGHGESDWNAAHIAYTMPQFGEDMRVLASRTGQRPVLVGASMGGLLGLGVQALYASFSAMVLVDITPRWETAGVERILDFMSAHPSGFASFDEAADAISTYLPHRRERKNSEHLRPLLRRGISGRYHWHWDPRMLDDIARAGLAHQDELERAARKIECPLLLISGGRSDLVSTGSIERFLSLVPHARHLQIADATHMVAGDHNDQFTDAILSFLSTLSPNAHRGVASAGERP